MPTANRIMRKFRVASVSSNANSFGLRGMIVMTEGGEAWEVAANHINLREKGADFRVPVGPESEPDWAAMGFEIPHRLPHVPPAVLKEVFGS